MYYNCVDVYADLSCYCQSVFLTFTRIAQTWRAVQPMQLYTTNPASNTISHFHAILINLLSIYLRPTWWFCSTQTHNFRAVRVTGRHACWQLQKHDYTASAPRHATSSGTGSQFAIWLVQCLHLLVVIRLGENCQAATYTHGTQQHVSCQSMLISSRCDVTSFDT